MTKLLLATGIILAMTACDERVGRGIHAPIVKTKVIYIEKQGHAPIQKEQEDVALVQDVPILEEELPVLPTPTELKESMPTKKGMNKKDKLLISPISTKGLDIANIRISNSPERTRLVFDSYSHGKKSSASGAYNYKYDASKKSIILTLKEYQEVSALGNAKARNYHNSIVKKIYLDNKDTNTIKSIIALKKDAKVNVFDIKEPGRIVIDIFPR